MSETLTDKFLGIVDGYYSESYDFETIHKVLEEVDFLYSRGLLVDAKLGRLKDYLDGRGIQNA